MSTPLRRPNGTWAKSNEDKSLYFAQHLSSVFTPNINTFDSTFTKTIQDELDIPLQMTLPPPAFHPSDIIHTIKQLPKNKAPGHDLITATILKELPRKAIYFLTYIFNSILRTTYFPATWKDSLIIMIHKPSKPGHLPSSYRPISLLPVFSKVFEKLMLRRIYPILESSKVIPDHQFGFRAKHSTIQQCHRIVDIISSALEKKQYVSAVFLDESQAFDRVWHDGLLSKIKRILPPTYFLILKSYLNNRRFAVPEGQQSYQFYPIQAGVPQGSILGPFLYNIYTSDIPKLSTTEIASYADDKALLSTNPDPIAASDSLQRHLTSVENWSRKWRIQFNNEKSVQITFTLRRATCPPVFLYGQPLPNHSYVKYLGLYLDRRLTWNTHIRLKRMDAKRRYKILLKLLDNRSKISINNKLQIYNSIIKPTWAYGVELWGSAKPSNINKIQTLQSIILRKITDAPYYVANRTIHNDLNVPSVQTYATFRYRSFHKNLATHSNHLIKILSSTHIPDRPRRRLKRRWPRDLL